MSLLAKEKTLAFIKHILTASGGASQADFDGLFDNYFQEIPQVKAKINPLLCAKDKLKTLQQHIQLLKNEKLRLAMSEIKLQQDKQILLINLVQCFMQTVINQMGWSADKSQKKKILLVLQQKTQTDGLSAEQLTYLLKNFISVSLMNRYYFKGETHTAKACLSGLSSPQYQSLATLLKLGNNIQYQDLLDLVSGSETRKEYFTSVKYKMNLYRFYQEQD